MNVALITEMATQLVMYLAYICLLVVLFRNFISLMQLLIASYVFATRVKPSAISMDLWQRYGDLALPVSVIVPAFNEELSIVQSVRSILALEYPEHEVIVVNDGSDDRTIQELIDGFDCVPSDREQIAVLQHTKILGVYQSRKHPNLVVIDKENGRKADASNAGIGFARTPLVCVIDADSIIETDGLLRATEPFMYDTGKVVAVGGAIRIANGCEIRGGSLRKIGISKDWLPRFQIVEYLRAFLTARVANAEANSLMLISGAFGIFRRSVLLEIGGYEHDTVAEDLELIVRIHRHMREQKREYKIGFVPEIVCWTEAPTTWAGLRNQRARWQQGALETLIRHRRMILNPRYGRIGMFSMFQVVVEDVIGPPAELIGYLVIPAALWLGVMDPTMAILFLCVTVLFGTGLSIGTLALEELQLKRTPSALDLVRVGLAAFVENFGYRQANLAFRLSGIGRHFRKDTSWAAVPREGFNADN
ncbi:glycosyltransferase family 2 protein [Parasphingorhabdus sp.]|uniref:glycosyltransferase family 2 protein n=1 Tax=Parasphingorhabdus sp. TaxID=2709688 RepID=UPI003A8D240A